MDYYYIFDLQNKTEVINNVKKKRKTFTFKIKKKKT
jgi:hypothetical protein